jgi:putative heme-binding domain-containing protein
MPGACYPSFGKPHDGLGFAPVMCEHAHGSTGIAGIVYFDGGVWGPDWQDHMLVGNPVTSKVNRDHITFTGSTPKAVEQPDFITSVDPWFRPVDLQLGPDSALYIADFYNRIIGHYEVPLDHPGRDRKSGRIWRVLKKDHTRTLPETAVRHLSPAQLATAMGDANLTRRSLALQETVDRAGQTQKTGPRVSPHELPTITAPPAAEALPAPALAMLHWVRARCGGEEPPPSSDPRVLAHKLRTQAAGSEGVPYAKAPDLRHASPQVLAVALETVVLSPSLPKFEELAEARKHIAAGDVRLAHAWRLAARSVLQRLPDWDTLPTGKFEEDTESELLTVSAAIPSAGSAAWLLRRLQRLGSPAYYESVGDLNRLLAHLARHTPPDLESDLVALVKACRPGDLDAQLDLMATIRAGRKTTDTAPGPAMREWAKSLEAELHQWLRLRATSPWIRSTTATDGAVNPWHLDKREVAGASLPFLSSLPPKGERLTGTLRSPDFVIPEQLTFWIAGHRGPPGAPAHERNAVRLRDAATHKMLAEAFPPREDAPRQVTWEFQPGPAEEIATAPVPPKRGYVEFVDGDSGRAYAWLAAGGFSPKLFELPSDNDERTNQRIEALARLSLDFPSPDTLTVLRALPHKERYFPSTREALATALAAAGSAPGWHALAALAREPGLAQMVFAVLEDPRRERDLIGDAFSTLPRRTQITLATGLAATPAHAHLLLAVAPPQLLADPVLSGKLQALGDPQVSTELARLIIAVPPGNAALDALIQLKLQGFRKEAGNAGRGEALFQTHCAACHRIGVKGNLVGPQLDGIGVRGAERLLEDILDPNRAVDPAFRMHFIKTKDGTVSGGLLRRDLDQQLVLADVAGQEHTVKKADIAEHQESPFSIMPAGFQDLLPGPMLMDLLAYLLERQP